MPSQIASRIMLYLFAINWTVVEPYSGYEAPEFEALTQTDAVLKLSQFDDGDYNLMVGDELSNLDAIAPINSEVGRLVISGIADVDGMYFSNKETLMQGVSVVQKYLKEKWGYDFSVKDET
ncbi:hypothetical protein [Phaeobacter inhibens]|uniref:hypothetical protein n=1 Tax=Phaeobacter inhibens TaxID=221822 RepID=UPI0024B86937|nr:hypothetical protein [Phaeobacter inhibens]WHP67305.1 hypothetical protein QMZ01_12215 [Phaeobacter inhibens]